MHFTWGPSSQHNSTYKSWALGGCPLDIPPGPALSVKERKGEGEKLRLIFSFVDGNAKRGLEHAGNWY